VGFNFSFVRLSFEETFEFVIVALEAFEIEEEYQNCFLTWTPTEGMFECNTYLYLVDLVFFPFQVDPLYLFRNQIILSS